MIESWLECNFTIERKKKAINGVCNLNVMQMNSEV